MNGKEISNDTPENIQRIIDLTAAIIQRIRKAELDKSQDPCLYMVNPQGVN